MRNRADGSVECEAQGPEDKLKVFMTHAERGPVYANVSRIEREEIPDRPDQKSFEIID